MRKILCVAFLFFSINVLCAQQNLTLYNLPTVPQVNYANPAHKHNFKFYIGLPVISSVYANFNHSGFTFSDAVAKDGDSLYFTVDNAISKMAKRNYVSIAADVDLLSFGFPIDSNYFQFSLRERVFGRFIYARDLIKFAWKGNDPDYIDAKADFSGTGVFGSHFREYGFNVSRNLTEKLTVGTRMKLLYGMENAQTKRSAISLYTAPKSFELTAKVDILANLSLPIDVEDTTKNEQEQEVDVRHYLFSSGNWGLGWDMGAIYNYNDEWTFSASLVDLGFIRWQKYPKNYKIENAAFTFEGIDFTPALYPNDSTDVLEQWEDTLSKIFDDTVTQDKYYAGMAPRIYLGAEYRLGERNTFAALFQGEYFRRYFFPSFSVSYTRTVKNWLGVTASYSYLNRSFNNLGLGFSVKGGPVQFYFISDNLAWLFNMAKIDGKIPVPQNTKNIHVHFGINLVFNEREKKDRDGDGVPNKKDECPDIPGLQEFKGCPDRDNDKIIDNEDKCPDIPGLVEFKGCPDTDNDKVIDPDDDCPDIPGLVEFKGCPDRDNDKVIDKEDDCPDIPGIVEMKGCPDADGDKITDHEDKCPDQAGPKENNGCPNQIFQVTEKGERLKESTKNGNGIFFFSDLPYNSTYLFELDPNNTEVNNDIQVLLKKEDGNDTMIIAFKGANKFFRYDFKAPPPPKKEEPVVEVVEEVPVVLEAEEEEIVSTAFTNLEFNSGKSTIRPTSYPGLTELVNLLKRKPKWNMKLTGHTDNQGSDALNMKLSQSRAEAVKKFIVDNGIEDKRVKTEWHGESKPIADNNTPEGRQMNRRVEMLIVEGEEARSQQKEKSPSPENILFKVQVMVSGKKMEADNIMFKGLESVARYFEGGLYKYTAGVFGSFEAAKALQDQLKKQGFPDAFVVAFDGSKRIAVEKARQALGQ